MPEFTAAAASNPIYRRHMDAVETGLCGIYRDGADDINFLEAFDDVRRIVASESMTIKQRLLAIGKRMERLRVGKQ